MEDFGEHPGMATSLVSSLIPIDVYGYCFSFFFSMTGDEEAEMNVYIRAVSLKTIVWTLKGDQGADWVFGQVCGTVKFNVLLFDYVYFSVLYCFE